MADYLDDWMEPENSANRVWLRNGKMHIIPYDEPGRLKDGSITLNNALQYLSSLSSSKISSSSSTTPRSSECNKSIQKILYSHTIHNYPARIFALHHNIIVILPEWIALFFQQYPQYLAKAIYYFHNYNNDKIKDILKLSLFNTMLNRITTTAAKASSNGTTNTTTPIRSADDHEQHIIALSLPLTRLLYAQLNFKNFKIPRKYHNLMRRISLSSSRKVMKAFDLGCRLSCGLECMYHDSIQQDRKRNNHASNSSSSSPSLPSLSKEGCLDDDKTWISLVSALQSLHYLQHPSSDNNINNNKDDVIIHKLKQLYLQSNIILTSLNEGKAEDKNNEVIGRKEDSFCVVLENICAKLLPFTDCSSTITTTTASIYGNIVYSNGNDKNADKLLFDSISKDQLVGDDDSWLYLTPDELDKELQDRMDRYTNNHHHDHHHDDNVDSHHNHQQYHNEHKMYQHQHDQQQQQQQQQQQSNDNYDDEENTSNSIETNKIEDTHDNDGEVAVNSNDQVDNNQLDSIIEGLKSFMSTKSDYDGVTSSIPIPSASSTSSLKSSTPSIGLSNIEEKQPVKKKMVAFNEMATTTTTTSATSNRNINNDYRDTIYVKVDTPSNSSITTGSVGSSSSSSSSSSSTSSNRSCSCSSNNSCSCSCCKSSTLGLKINYDYLNRLMKDMVLNNDNIDKVYVLGDDKKDNNAVDYKNYNNIININYKNNLNDSCTADDGRSIKHIAGDGDDEDDDDIDDGIDQHDNSAGDVRVDAVVDDSNNMKDFLTYFSNDDLREFDGDSINDSDDSDDDKDFNDNDGDVDVDVKDYGFNPHFNSKHHQLHTYDNITGSKTSHLNDVSDASYVGKGNFIITTTNEMESNKSKYVNHIDGNDFDDDDDIDSDDEEENDDSVVGDDVKMIKRFQVFVFAKYMQKSSLSFISMHHNKYKHRHNHNHNHRNHFYYFHL